jgi:hypothetical protein
MLGNFAQTDFSQITGANDVIAGFVHLPADHCAAFPKLSIRARPIDLRQALETLLPITK